MRRVSERCDAARIAAELLQEAHDACFRSKGRSVLGMSHGPFSGVNKVLGMIALMDAKIGDLERQLAKAKGKVGG